VQKVTNRGCKEPTQPKTQKKRGFIEIRNIVKNNILKIRKEVILTVSLRKGEQQPQHYKATELRFDILNIPSHMFGKHKRCKERGHICEDDREIEKNYVPFLKLYGLYSKIEDAVKYLSVHSDSLLLNVTNNPAESFNSIICKAIAGKHINLGARGSYNVAGTVVQYNTQQVLTELYQDMNKTVPAIVENLEKRRQKLQEPENLEK